MDLDNYRLARERSLQYETVNADQCRTDVIPIKTFDLHW